MTEMLQHWVAGQAGCRPDAVAVACRGERLSYGELETSSNQLARALKERGCVRGDRVSVLLTPSPLAAICALGIYKADCVYVPLDPSRSVVRLAAIMDACGSRYLLASASLAPRVRGLAAELGLTALHIGWIGEPGEADGGLPLSFRFSDIGVLPGTPPPSAHRGQDTAHLLFVDGPDGRPRGVVTTHANLNTQVDWARREFRLSETERLACRGGLAEELSLFQAFTAFASGAELHLQPVEADQPPRRLADWIRDSGITHWCSRAVVLQALAEADAVQPLDFPELRRVLWHGEPLPAAALGYWMKRLPHIEFTGLYGHPETTVAGSWHTVTTFPEPGGEPLPLGHACGGGELLVLDHNFQPAAPDEEGDLYIGGALLSPGYWNEPEATLRAFPLLDGVGRVFRTGRRAQRRVDGLVYPGGESHGRLSAGAHEIPAGLPLSWYAVEEAGANRNEPRP